MEEGGGGFSELRPFWKWKSFGYVKIIYFRFKNCENLTQKNGWRIYQIVCHWLANKIEHMFLGWSLVIYAYYVMENSKWRVQVAIPFVLIIVVSLRGYKLTLIWLMPRHGTKLLVSNSNQYVSFTYFLICPNIRISWLY